MVVPSCVRLLACATRATRPRTLTSPTLAVACDSSTIASIVSLHRKEPRTPTSRPDRLMLTAWPDSQADAPRDIQRKPRRARQTLDDGHVWWQSPAAWREDTSTEGATYRDRRRSDA